MLPSMLQNLLFQGQQIADRQTASGALPPAGAMPPLAIAPMAAATGARDVAQTMLAPASGNPAPDVQGEAGVRPGPDAWSVPTGAVRAAMPSTPTPSKDDDQWGSTANTLPPQDEAEAKLRQAEAIRQASLGEKPPTGHKMTGAEAGIAALLTLLSPDLGAGAVNGFLGAKAQKTQEEQQAYQQRAAQAEQSAQALEGEAKRIDQQAQLAKQDQWHADAFRQQKDLEIMRTTGKTVDSLQATLRDPKASPTDKAMAMESLNKWDKEHYPYSPEQIEAVRNSPWAYGDSLKANAKDLNGDLGIVNDKSGKANPKAQADAMERLRAADGKKYAYTDAEIAAKRGETWKWGAQQDADAAFKKARTDFITQTTKPAVQKLIAEAGALGAKKELDKIKARGDFWRANIAKKEYEWYDQTAGAKINEQGAKAEAALMNANTAVARVIQASNKDKAKGGAGAVTATSLFNARQASQKGADEADAHTKLLEEDDVRLNARLTAIKDGTAQSPKHGEQKDLEDQLANNASERAYWSVMHDRAVARIGAIDKIPQAGSAAPTGGTAKAAGGAAIAPLSYGGGGDPNRLISVGGRKVRVSEVVAEANRQLVLAGNSPQARQDAIDRAKRYGVTLR